MSYSIGNRFRLTCFGQSHSSCIGGVLDGIPAGIRLDTEKINAFLQRRRPGSNAQSTARREADEPKILSGLTADGVTCGAPLAFEIENSDTKSADYGEMLRIPRPMHADYPAFARYGDSFDFRGGGQFSGRMTAVLCFAGAVALQLLESRGIVIGAHALAVNGIYDTPFDAACIEAELLNRLGSEEYPIISKASEAEMLAAIAESRSRGDSVGGIIECAAVNLPVGIGEPIYGSVESRISQYIFSIPAVTGLEFGSGFAGAKLTGSKHNDAFCVKNGKIATETNNHGGILGGLTTGMPLVLRTAVKPTPSIAVEQKSVDMLEMRDSTLKIKGRHDPCIVLRAVPCVISAVAAAMLDLIIETGDCKWN